jgi:hypothetical protein
VKRQGKIILETQIFENDAYATYTFVKNRFRHATTALDFPPSEWKAGTLKRPETSKLEYKLRYESSKKASYLGMMAFYRFFTDS